MSQTRAMSASEKFSQSLNTLYQTCGATSTVGYALIKTLLIKTMERYKKSPYIKQAFEYPDNLFTTNPDAYDDVIVIREFFVANINKFIEKTGTEYMKSIEHLQHENETSYSQILSDLTQQYNKGALPKVPKGKLMPKIELTPNLIQRLNPKLAPVTVYSSTNYRGVSHLQGQRHINEPHVKHLQESIAERNLLDTQFVILNGAGACIDGQHKLEAAEREGVPFYFIVRDDLTVEDVVRLNTQTRNWSVEDYLQSYLQLYRQAVKEGNKEEVGAYAPYNELHQFMKTHETSVNIALPLLYGYAGGESRANFKQGRFEIRTLPTATTTMEICKELHTRYGLSKAYVNGTYFTRAVFRMVRAPLFVRATWQKKIDYQHKRLLRGSCVEDYLEMLESIYNNKNAKTQEWVKFLQDLNENNNRKKK